jgi:hypothetical protein
MPLPTFLIIGAMKSGTSSLWRYLSAHPQVYMSVDKEPGFFVERLTWNNGLDWYRSLFDAAGDAIAVGEGSTSYTKAPMHAGVPARIASVLPDVRMIYLVRHPIERMVSQYIHRRSSGKETHPIEEALLAKPNYVDLSRYAYQIEQFTEHFDRTQILVITSEALRDRRAATMARVESFIGVETGGQRAGIDTVHHRSADKRIRTRTLDRLRQRTLVRTLRRHAPLPARRVASRLLSKKASREHVAISDELRETLTEQLPRRSHGSAPSSAMDSTAGASPDPPRGPARRRNQEFTLRKRTRNPALLAFSQVHGFLHAFAGPGALF